MLYPVPDSPDAEIVNIPDVIVPQESYKELPDSMWQLPKSIADSAFRDLHERLISGLRRDTAHLPTGTLQAMQIERIAYYYIVIRFNEMRLGDAWSTKEKNAMYKLWRDLASDFNQVAYGNKISPEDLHAIVATHTAKIVAKVLRSIPNDQAKPLYEKFAAALESGPAER